MWVITSSPSMYLSSGGKGAISKEGFVFNTVEMPAAPTSSECDFPPIGLSPRKSKGGQLYLFPKHYKEEREKSYRRSGLATAVLVSLMFGKT